MSVDIEAKNAALVSAKAEDSDNKEVLRLIGKIAVQYRLPAGDPCWIAAKIGTCLPTPLDTAIKNYRRCRMAYRFAHRNYESVMKPYNGYADVIRTRLLNEPATKERIRWAEGILEPAYYNLTAAAVVVRGYMTPENQEDIDNACYA
jgi:hypothetical protein